MIECTKIFFLEKNNEIVKIIFLKIQARQRTIKVSEKKKDLLNSHPGQPMEKRLPRVLQIVLCMCMVPINH